MAAEIGIKAWAVVATAVTTQRESLARRPLFALEVALALVQTRAITNPVPKLWLLTLGSPAHAGSWGLGRSARVEASLPLVCIHARPATQSGVDTSKPCSSPPFSAS